MRQTSFVAIACFLLCSTHGLLLEPSTCAVRAADDEPWQSLFNGSDFASWKVVALRDPAPAVIEEGRATERLSSKGRQYQTSLDRRSLR